MDRILSFRANDEDEGTRLDVFMAAKLGISRSAAQNLIVLSDKGKPLGKSYAVKSGEEYSASVPEPETLEAVAQDIPVEIVYEDDDLLVVDKPQGMVVHPACGNKDNTLVNALLYKCEGRLSTINGTIRPGIVHRIDKDTAGLLIVAKNDAAHRSLAKQISEHSFTRKYRAVVIGNVKQDNGTVDIPVGRSKTDRKKRACGAAAVELKNAITHYRVLKRYRGYTYLELTLETGRTHQIRIHMKHLGHPVLGDKLYCRSDEGAGKFGLTGQCLCAYYIKFIHPADGRVMEFSSPLPEFFNQTLEKLEKAYL